MVPLYLRLSYRLDSSRNAANHEREGANLSGKDFVIPTLCPPFMPATEYVMDGQTSPGSAFWRFEIVWFGPTVTRAEKSKRQVGDPPPVMVPHGKGIATFPVGEPFVQEDDSEDDFFTNVTRRDTTILEYRGACLRCGMY